ncbi:MAG: hypothetical protein OYM47_08670 [Gemmatimonadota bacterium]|nr:hypothetical protein [Gemmatimonadota bacterium]
MNEASPACAGVFSIELGQQLFDRFITWPGAGKLDWIKYLRFIPWDGKKVLRILYDDRWHFFEDVISSLMNAYPVKLKLQ